MAGGNPFMPPGSSLPTSMPGANPGGPVQGGQSLSDIADAMGQNPADGQPARGAAVPPGSQGRQSGNNGVQVPPSKQGQPFADVHQNLKQVQAQYKDNMRAQQVLDHLRVELDQLMDYGDMVRPEQVIEAAGRLVGHGIGATQLAQIMSDMPAVGGDGLASWIRMHDLTITNAEQMLARQTALFQHQLGVASIKSLAASHLEQTSKEGRQAMQQSITAPQPMANDLAGPTMVGPAEQTPGGDNA